MKVLMLGWEYPPHITGGLGTACEGLTRGLAKLGVAVNFAVPHLVGDERASHMQLVDANWAPELLKRHLDGEEPNRQREGSALAAEEPTTDELGVDTIRIPSYLAPYWSEDTFAQYLAALKNLRPDQLAAFHNLPNEIKALLGTPRSSSRTSRYGADIFSEVGRFAANVVTLTSHLEFDLIHAHDWMTFPAAVAVARITGKPLVVHIHSLEFDRSGSGGNDRIKEIERMGADAANIVIAVSYYTSSLLQRELGIPQDKIRIVHNGVYSKEEIRSYRRDTFEGSRVVLFLGRITFQKGPDYFVEAAARVVPHVPKVLFVMAGAGDMLPQIVERVHHLGLEKNFYFPGFLKGEEVEQMFSVADLYVMPSVSEPFGISALEAISANTPVIISRQSGVAEVLSHALKVDFWDVQRLADLIINALLHEELREDMVSMARDEVRRLRWDAAASKTEELYRSVTGRR